MVNTQRLSSTEEIAKRGASRITKNSSRPKDSAQMTTIQTFHLLRFQRGHCAMILPRAGCTMSLVKPLYQVMGYLCLQEEHDSKAVRVFDIQASIGVSVSEVQAEIQKGSLAVLSLCTWLNVCRQCQGLQECATSFGLLLRGRQQGPPRFSEEGQESAIVAWKTAPPWWKRYQTRARTIQNSLNSHRRLRAREKGGSQVFGAVKASCRRCGG